ncbi:hypothetical protein ACWGNA_12445 [Brucella cytisi]|uniref:hypothetical protein n=1 Tax=Brucella cytisi TaxID=407152 RepID=UPI0035E260FC
MSYTIFLLGLLSASFGLSWPWFASIFSQRVYYRKSVLALMMTASPICITAMVLSVSDFGLFYSGLVATAGWLLSALIRHVIFPAILVAMSAGALIAYLQFGAHII